MAEGQRLGHGRVAARHQHLVHRLHPLAGTHRPEVADPAAHHRQQRPGPLQIGCGAPHQHRQRAGPGPLGAAGNRRIEVGHAALGQLAGQGFTAGGGDRGEVDHQAAGGQAADRGSRTFEQHGADGAVVAEAKAEHWGGGGGSSRGGGPLGALAGQGLLPLAAAVVHRQAPARPQQVGGHRRAEGAEADEGRLHRLLRPVHRRSGPFKGDQA